MMMRLRLCYCVTLRVNDKSYISNVVRYGLERMRRYSECVYLHASCSPEPRGRRTVYIGTITILIKTAARHLKDAYVCIELIS